MADQADTRAQLDDYKKNAKKDEGGTKYTVDDLDKFKVQSQLHINTKLNLIQMSSKSRVADKKSSQSQSSKKEGIEPSILGQ